MKCIDGWFWGK